ncbi:hypothetical protein BKA62DRAFT_47599 [Auriculariales sp. MPI-PUGE-AT-0066]|nr:hypothetical protein BKA62DRAFT_47599 [Auriculariales sp. MPI-PUGE-AT-0066]
MGTGSNTRSDYALLEVEMYLVKPGHEDSFTHSSEAQKHPGQWYFHRAPTRSPPPPGSNAPTPGFRGGTRKGLDLTFGGAGATGGILFRSMRRVSDGTLVSGPSLLVDELLNRSRQPSIAALVGTWPTLSAFPSNGTPGLEPHTGLNGVNGTALAFLGPAMHLVSSDAPRSHAVHCSPRIGLDLSHKSVSSSATDPRVRFVAAPYRYFVGPEALTVNGRMQTFIGLYEELLALNVAGAASGANANANANEQRAVLKVAEMMALRSGTAEEYVRYYRAGRKTGDIDKFVGVKTSSPKAYLELVGALRTFLAASDETATIVLSTST